MHSGEYGSLTIVPGRLIVWNGDPASTELKQLAVSARRYYIITYKEHNQREGSSYDTYWQNARRILTAFEPHRAGEIELTSHRDLGISQTDHNYEFACCRSSAFCLSSFLLPHTAEDHSFISLPTKQTSPFSVNRGSKPVSLHKHWLLLLLN